MLPGTLDAKAEWVAPLSPASTAGLIGNLQGRREREALEYLYHDLHGPYLAGPPALVLANYWGHDPLL